MAGEVEKKGGLHRPQQPAGSRTRGEVLRAVHVPLPLGAFAHGARPSVHYQ